MSRSNLGLVLAYVAATAILPRTLVKYGASDGSAAQATTNADAYLGISTDIPAAEGETVDVIRSGVAPVVYGGNVTRGDRLTGAAGGRVVNAGTGPVGAQCRIIGIAEVSGVAGDIGAVLIAPGTLTGLAA